MPGYWEVAYGLMGLRSVSGDARTGGEPSDMAKAADVSSISHQDACAGTVLYTGRAQLSCKLGCGLALG